MSIENIQVYLTDHSVFNDITDLIHKPLLNGSEFPGIVFKSEYGNTIFVPYTSITTIAIFNKEFKQ